MGSKRTYRIKTILSKLFPFVIFLTGLMILMFVLITQTTWLSKISIFDHSHKAYQFYKMAKKFPKGTIYYNQYMAIARAYFFNQKSFSFETNQMPMPQTNPLGPQVAPETTSSIPTQSPQL